MITLSLVNAATTASTAIGIANSKSTNNKLTVNSNNIQIPTPGVYEIVGNATVTSMAAENSGISIYVNGNQSGNESFYLAAASGEVKTIPINTTFEVKESNTTGYVQVQFMPVGAPTISGSTIIIKQIV